MFRHRRFHNSLQSLLNGYLENEPAGAGKRFMRVVALLEHHLVQDLVHAVVAAAQRGSDDPAASAPRSPHNERPVSSKSTCAHYICRRSCKTITKGRLERRRKSKFKIVRVPMVLGLSSHVRRGAGQVTSRHGTCYISIVIRFRGSVPRRRIAATMNSAPVSRLPFLLATSQARQGYSAIVEPR